MGRMIWQYLARRVLPDGWWPQRMVLYRPCGCNSAECCYCRPWADRPDAWYMEVVA